MVFFYSIRNRIIQSSNITKYSELKKITSVCVLKGSPHSRELSVKRHILEIVLTSNIKRMKKKDPTNKQEENVCFLKRNDGQE